MYVQRSRVSKSIKREIPRIGTLVHLFLAFDILASNTVLIAECFFVPAVLLKIKIMLQVISLLFMCTVNMSPVGEAGGMWGFGHLL